jgi:hypothetical protein
MKTSIVLLQFLAVACSSTTLQCATLHAQRLSADGFHAVLEQATPAAQRIEYSSNLTDWSPWLTLDPVAGAQALLDPSASQVGQRFYRARELAASPGAISTAELLNQMWSRGAAEGSGPVRLRTFPIAVTDISHINPMGLLSSGHTTPTDHLSMVARKTPDGATLCDVLAVADGRLVAIQWRPNPAGGQPDPTVFDRAVDLKLVIEHSATCWSYVDHLIEIDPAIQQAVGRNLTPGPPIHTRIPVRAGQRIGKVARGFTFDFALMDTTVTLKGFVIPSHFLKRDPWKLHTVDPFPYVDEPLRSELLEFNPRKVPPLGGRIDYDIDGKLVGNWYRDGSGGYAGLAGRIDYWVGHLTFAYHHVASDTIIVSVGELEGRPRQFAVRNNAPDPANVDVASGLVRYVLETPSTDNRTGRKLADFEPRTHGVVLLQLLEPRKLKVGFNLTDRPEDVQTFGAGARIYER